MNCDLIYEKKIVGEYWLVVYKKLITLMIFDSTLSPLLTDEEYCHCCWTMITISTKQTWTIDALFFYRFGIRFLWQKWYCLFLEAGVVEIHICSNSDLHVIAAVGIIPVPVSSFMEFKYVDLELRVWFWTTYHTRHLSNKTHSFVSNHGVGLWSVSVLDTYTTIPYLLHHHIFATCTQIGATCGEWILAYNHTVTNPNQYDQRQMALYSYSIQNGLRRWPLRWWLAQQQGHACSR